MKITAALKAYFKTVYGKTVAGETVSRVIVNGAAAVGAAEHLPEVTAADNGKILKVVDGEWKAVTPT